MTDGAENKIVVVLEDLRDAIPPETRPLRRLLRWFETKNGSTILTFVLTGILGTAISFWFSYFQAERDRARTELAASEENWNNINDLLGVIAYSRLTDASLVASAMKWRGGADELKDRWKSYQASYRDYNISVYKGHLALRDFAPEENREIFNSYFFDVISTQFADIDDCLTRAYDAYNGEVAPGLNSIALLDARIAAAQQECPAKVFHAKNLALQGCLATFETEMGWAIRTKRMQLGQKLSLVPRPVANTWRWMFVSCEHDGECLERRNGKQLPAALAKGCGQLPESDRPQSTRSKTPAPSKP